MRYRLLAILIALTITIGCFGQRDRFSKFAQSVIASDESADATLTALGEAHVRGDEDRISYHLGTGGEVAGEATLSMLQQISVSLDPASFFDADTDIFLFEVNSKRFPNGIIIDYWSVSYNADPTTELDANLRYADAWLTLANPALIDVIDTLVGVSSEDTDANINGGSAVAAGKVIYIDMDADPADANIQINFTMIFHAEED
jgi:hypothetical protein